MRMIISKGSKYKFLPFTDTTFTGSIKDKCKNAKWRNFIYESYRNRKKDR